MANFKSSSPKFCIYMYCKSMSQEMASKSSTAIGDHLSWLLKGRIFWIGPRFQFEPVPKDLSWEIIFHGQLASLSEHALLCMHRKTCLAWTLPWETTRLAGPRILARRSHISIQLNSHKSTYPETIFIWPMGRSFKTGSTVHYQIHLHWYVGIFVTYDITFTLTKPNIFYHSFLVSKFLLPKFCMFDLIVKFLPY